MGDLPSSIPDHLVTRIRAGLLRVHSKKLEGAKLNSCLKESYDVCATAWRDGGQVLSDAILCETIPVWVFHWAVVNKWVPYPPIRKTNRSPLYRLGEHRPPAFENVPQNELTVRFGEYMVTEWYKADIIQRLNSRIIYWRAEALSPAVPSVEGRPTPDPMAWRMAARAIAADEAMRARAQQEIGRTRSLAQTDETPTSESAESIGVQIDRLREECRWGLERLAEAVDLDPTSVSRHLSDKAVPHLKHIGRYEKVFSNELNRKVLIQKTPRKRR
jgi:hypothetical protein